jgi:hypothetical protein
LKIIQPQADLLLENIRDESVHAFYDSKQNRIVIDCRKLSELVDEMVHSAREAGVHLEDSETIWICKFASLVAHETFHKVLTGLEGHEVSRKFDNLHFAEFMEKIPEGSIAIELWSDASDACPIGDTWFW